MSRKLAVIFLVPLLLLGGCDAFFDNVFEGLYTLEVPSAAELGTMAVADLERLAEDPDFFEALSADPAKEQAVLDNLAPQFSDGTADTPEEQRAAALYAEVLLRTSGADGIVAGLAGYLASADGFAQFDTDPSAALSGLFGQSLPTLAEIEAMVTALDRAWDAYEAIGAGLGTAPLDESLNAGDLAFNAALAAALQGVTVTSGGTLAEFIHASIQGTAGGFTATFEDDIFSEPAMSNLLSAAGIDPSDLGL